MYCWIYFFCLFIDCFDTYNLGSLLSQKYSRKNLITTGLGMPLIIKHVNFEKNNDVIVVGGTGYLGGDIIRELNKNKVSVLSLSRNPYELGNLTYKSLVNYKSVDISDFKSLQNIFKGAKNVIFAANAKKRNQDYNDVHNIGLSNVAVECINSNIKKLVVVSATCNRCKENEDIKIDNTCGLKCEDCLAKQMGEDNVREIYRNQLNSYTICRAGFLSLGERRGIREIEINQDYTKSGIISRMDLADVCINAMNNKNTAFTTFETYYRDTAQPYDIKVSLDLCKQNNKSVEECFFGEEFKTKKPKQLDEVLKSKIKGSLFATGNEYIGNNWNELFKNLKKDKLNTININNFNQNNI